MSTPSPLPTSLPSSLPKPKTPHPPHFSLTSVIRLNILALHPYRCARDDYSEGILLDANENALGHSIVLPPTPAPNGHAINGHEDLPEELKPTLDLDLHRYPSPSHPSLKSSIAKLRGLPNEDWVFLGVGSDEIIDLLIRICVKPGSDESILITPPTYGMYAVCAAVNDVRVDKVNLELSGTKGEGGEQGRFSIRVADVKKQITPSTKLIFLTSPGNPTGTLLSLSSIRSILDYQEFKGIVVVDEAYVDFASEGSSAVSLVEEYENIIVMQTLSKSFGLAAIRLGVALSQPPLLQILSNTKAPYNISSPTAYLAELALKEESLEGMKVKVNQLKASRTNLIHQLSSPKFKALGVGSVIGGNDANFVLMPILQNPSSLPSSPTPVLTPDNTRALKVYKSLAEENGVVVRFRGGEKGCEGCLRVSVGSEKEIEVFLGRLEGVLGRV
ncbi:hypothetical protein JAAARDRAFT_32482 [Jaapia argillacea MUCL 33604]|uniref:histidinol-phosphate transaminase n=1 Tax=Jaapia argillacea MUCL 33604 TaxID=933084 RepID=A0A067PZ45_9AGAM|nr:hypothetical protein JAAARDRAFT_32482 [Jaapia argillacea MUCL 33604]